MCLLENIYFGTHSFDDIQVCVIELFFVILLKHQTRMVGIRMTDPSFLVNWYICQILNKVFYAHYSLVNIDLFCLLFWMESRSRWQKLNF